MVNISSDIHKHIVYFFLFLTFLSSFCDSQHIQSRRHTIEAKCFYEPDSMKLHENYSEVFGNCALIAALFCSGGHV